MQQEYYTDIDQIVDFKYFPRYLQEAIVAFYKGLALSRRDETYTQFGLDYEELRSCINVAEIEQDISSERAWELRYKILQQED